MQLQCNALADSDHLLIERFGQQALAWLCDQKHLFSPNYTSSLCYQLLINPAFEIKPSTELVFLWNLLKCTDWYEDVRVRTLGNFIASWQPEDVLAMAQNTPGGIMLLANLAFFESIKTKGRSSRYRTALEKMLRQGILCSVGNSIAPFRLLDIAYSLGRVGVAYELPNWHELYVQTIAAKAKGLAYLSNYDLYSITHTIFYLTDMGQRTADDVIQGSSQRLCELVQKLLGVVLRDKDWDLTAEFLLCWSFLGIPLNSVMCEVAWQQLVLAQLADGAVPSPSFDPAAEDQNKGNVTLSETGYRFFNCYHTTLVAAAAAASWCTSSARSRRGQ